MPMNPQSDWRPRLDPELRDIMEKFGITKADLEAAGWQLVIMKYLESKNLTWADVAMAANLAG